MRVRKFFFAVAAAAACTAATSASSSTLGFSNSTAVASGNVIFNCGQDGLVTSITEAKSRSIGANLFATMFCLTGTGNAAPIGGHNAGGLGAYSQGQNGASGNGSTGKGSQDPVTKNGALDEDAASGGIITAMRKSDTPFWSRGLNTVDKQPKLVSKGTQTCGPAGNGDPSQTGCTDALPSLLGIGDSVAAKSAGSAGVKPVEPLAAVPLPAGFVLLLGGLGALAFWRRRSTV